MTCHVVTLPQELREPTTALGGFYLEEDTMGRSQHVGTAEKAGLLMDSGPDKVLLAG